MIGGDASVFPVLPQDRAIIRKRKNVQKSQSDERQRRKLQKTNMEGDSSSIELPLQDTHRTGAKCVLEGGQDRKEVGVSYHTIGALRTKPGRGDRTL